MTIFPTSNRLQLKIINKWLRFRFNVIRHRRPKISRIESK